MNDSGEKGGRGVIAVSVEALRHGWRSFAIFELLTGVLSLALYAPLSAWIVSRIIASSGSQAVSNYELTAFFLSPTGLFLVVLAGTVWFALMFFQIGGRILIALAVQRRQRVPADRLLFFVCRAFATGLWRLGLRQFMIYALLLLPVLGIAALCLALFLSESDINFYLQTKPPAFQWSAALTGVAFAVWLVLAIRCTVRWIFSVPVLLLDQGLAREALRESKRLVETRFWAVVRCILLWLIFAGVLFIVTAGIHYAVKHTALAIAGHHAGRAVAAVALIQGVDLLLAVLFSFATAVSFAAVIAESFREARGERAEALPEALRARGLEDDEAGKPKVSFAMALAGVAVALFIGTVVFASMLAASIKFDAAVEVTAHRGSSVEAPENTMSAIRLAIEDGADWVEFDVQETSDGVLVLMHDKDLMRVTGEPGNIWETSAAALAQRDVGAWFSQEFAGERAPTLAEVFEETQGRIRLNIELKFNGHDRDLAGATARAVREAGRGDDAVITSLDHSGVREVKTTDPELATGLIVTAGIGDPTRLEVNLLSVSAGAVTRDLIARAHAAGKEVHVWTVNEPDEMLRMIHMGVDNIITDVPAVAVALQKEREGMSDLAKLVLYLSDLLEGRVSLR